MSDWSGEDRRASNVSLQDILLEVRECRNDIGHLKTSFDLHLADDKENFGAIRKDITFLQRFAFSAIGAWAIIQFLTSSGALNFNGGSVNTNAGNATSVSRNNANVG